MSNVFFYEPFYDLDRFIETLSGASQSQKRAPRQQNSGEGVARSYRPRCVINEIHLFQEVADRYHITDSTSTRTQTRTW